MLILAKFKESAERILTLQGEGRSMDLTCELLLWGHLYIKFLVTLFIRPDNFGDIRWKWFFMFTDSSMYYPAIMQSCIRSIRGREVHILTAWEILKQCHYCCEAEIWYLCKIFHCLSTLFLAIYLLHTATFSIYANSWGLRHSVIGGRSLTDNCLTVKETFRPSLGFYLP